MLLQSFVKLMQCIVSRVYSLVVIECIRVVLGCLSTNLTIAYCHSVVSWMVGWGRVGREGGPIDRARIEGTVVGRGVVG